jgi:hypothetical protein
VVSSREQEVENEGSWRTICVTALDAVEEHLLAEALADADHGGGWTTVVITRVDLFG